MQKYKKVFWKMKNYVLLLYLFYKVQHGYLYWRWFMFQAVQSPWKS